MDTVYVVDRIEDGRWIVLEDPDGHVFQLPRRWFTGRLREGDVVRVTTEEAAGEGNGGTRLVLQLDEEERRRRAAGIAELRARLPRGPEGDIRL
jgi:hypothetical protein